MKKHKKAVVNGRLAPSYSELRRRVKEEYGLPTLTMADHFIGEKFLELERQRGGTFRDRMNKKDNPPFTLEDIERLLGGGRQ